MTTDLTAAPELFTADELFAAVAVAGPGPYVYTVRQRCTVIERTAYRITLPHPAEVYADPDYREDLADVLESAIRGEYPGVEVEVLSNDHDDDPVGDYNEWDHAERVAAADPDAPDLSGDPDALLGEDERAERAGLYERFWSSMEVSEYDPASQALDVLLPLIPTHKLRAALAGPLATGDDE